MRGELVHVSARALHAALRRMGSSDYNTEGWIRRLRMIYSGYFVRDLGTEVDTESLESFCGMTAKIRLVSQRGVLGYR